MSHKTPIKQRLHITFGKFGALKYIGHLDLAKVWERVLRRADLPILYTEGFNTRPRIALATALPLGITSECEIVDVSLREPLPTLDDVLERIESVSPPGLRIFKIESVPVRSPTLQRRVHSAEYRIRFEDGMNRDVLQAAVEQILSRQRIVKVEQGRRRKSSYDMRPMIHTLHVSETGDLIAHLSAGERGNLRPSDLVDEMGLGDIFYTAHRFRLHIDDYRRDRARKEPKG